MVASRIRRTPATGPSGAVLWPVLLALVVLLTGASGSCSEVAPCAAVTSVVADEEMLRAATPGERDTGRGESTGEHEAVRPQTVGRTRQFALLRVPASLDASAQPPATARRSDETPTGGTGARRLIELNVSRT
ncbi:hypothetical protein Acsp04_43880 [Actinomadura sp. NBRC 104425]|uniref:hypothetical protein n=1 Tax=Actinomadura sp. NBRC 104425 TaxID=3032204 RepID=UPI0024A5FCD8|nr:hypothetical protein [Actinomadura sp. NBRC 104425]GLZ14153.1 hypothetical protein Acsp04_43880 [Actinomadura sp. NBRC 104425]